MLSRTLLGGFAAALFASHVSAQTITEIPSITVPHTTIDMDNVGPAGPTSYLGILQAGSPCSSALAGITFAPSSTTGQDVYDTVTSRGRGLAWSGSGLVLVDSPSGTFQRCDGTIALGTPCTEIGFSAGDLASAMTLEFYTGANFMSSFTTSSFGTPGPKYFRMTGNTFDRVVLRALNTDGWVFCELVLENRVEVEEFPYMLGMYSMIDMDAAATGATSVAALNAAGAPMPANLRDLVLTPTGGLQTVYDQNTTQGRALARNAAGQLVLVDPPSGVYTPFSARIDLQPSRTFGISIGDWGGAFALQFYYRNNLLTTISTAAFATAAPKYYYMRGAAFDRVDVYCLQATGRWVIPAIYVQVGANDCCDALPIRAGENGPFHTLSSSTSSPSWACGNGGNDIWFAYTATCSGAVRVETCGLSVFDTTLEAFGGVCSNLQQITCSDDSCTRQSSVLFAVELGERYLVRAGGYNGATGALSLRVTEFTSGNGTFVGIGSNCGNVGIAATGLPDIGGSVQYTMFGVEGVPFILIGLTPLGLQLCPAGCVLGLLPETSISGASLSSPIPCDPLLVGGIFYVQGVDLGGTFGCNAGAPAQLTLTHTIRTTIG